MKKISLTSVLLILVVIFAGGSVYLFSTLPEGCSDYCGPVIQVHHMNTFYSFSPANIPGFDYYNRPEIVYDDGRWILPGKYESDVNSGYKFTDKNSLFHLENDKSGYTPDVEIKGNKIFFDSVIYNNVGHSVVNITFDVVFDVTIKKNEDGAYGEYSRYDPDLWRESVTVENFYENSSQEIRIYAPLFPVKNSESFSVEVYLLYPENLTADDGTKLVYDNGEYIPAEYVPDVYDLSDSDKRRKIRIYEYFIVKSGFEGEV